MSKVSQPVTRRAGLEGQTPSIHLLCRPSEQAALTPARVYFGTRHIQLCKRIRHLHGIKSQKTLQINSQNVR